LPYADLHTVVEGGAGIEPGTGIYSLVQDGDFVTLEIGSGSHDFEYP